METQARKIKSSRMLQIELMGILVKVQKSRVLKGMRTMKACLGNFR